MPHFGTVHRKLDIQQVMGSINNYRTLTKWAYLFHSSLWPLRIDWETRKREERTRRNLILRMNSDQEERRTRGKGAESRSRQITDFIEVSMLSRERGGNK